MQHSDLVIKGGTVVTPYGAVPADIWIKDGKIQRVAKDTLKKMCKTESGYVTEQAFDASDYYVIPGFLTISHLQVNRMRSVNSYLEQVRSFIRKGITSMVDTIDIEEWMKREQLFYQLTPHYNSPIDYAIQLGINAAQFHPSAVRQWIALGFRLFQLTARSEKELDNIPWDDLSPVLQTGKPCIEFRVAGGTTWSAEQKKMMVYHWLQDCRKAQVRTFVKGIDPFTLNERDLFYHIAMITGDKCTKVFDYLTKNWYQNLSAFSLLEQLKLDVAKKGWDAETLLCLLVRMASTNVAKAIGCYPRKGSLLPGADADLCLLQKDAWLTNIDLYTILNFSEICLPAHVMSNGRWLYQNGQFTPVLGIGKFHTDLRPYNYVI